MARPGGLRRAHATARGLVVAPPRALRSPARGVRQSLRTRRDECGTPTAGRHLAATWRGAPGAGHRRLFQAPDRDCARAQRRDSPRLALQCTTRRWACERYGGRHRGQRGFVGAVERLAASRSDLPPPAHWAQPGGADSGPGQAGQCGNPCLGADCCHTAGRAGLRLAAPAAPGSGRSSSPRPALLAAGPGAGRALGATAWRWT